MVRTNWKWLLAAMISLSFAKSLAYAQSIPYAYSGEIISIVPSLESYVQVGDIVTGSFNYEPDEDLTRGTLSNWTFNGEQFSFVGNGTFAYFPEPFFTTGWQFDIFGSVAGTIGGDARTGVLFDMTSADFSDYPDQPPPLFEQVIERVSGGQITFFLDEIGLQILLTPEDVTPVPIPGAWMLLLSALAMLNRGKVRTCRNRFRATQIVINPS